MTLPEKLHHIREKLLECFDVNLPDPDQLTHSGSVTVRGQSFTTLSSVSLDDLTKGNGFTIYLHSAEGNDNEEINYFHFEGRREISAVYIKLKMVEGSVRQSVTFSSLPREIFVQMVERRLGRGGKREKRPRPGGFMGRRSRPRPMPAEEPSDSE